MSISETELEKDDIERATHDYIELRSLEDLQVLPQKQVLSYINKLHRIIQKYDIKLAKYKEKLTKLLSTKNATYNEKSTQILREDFETLETKGDKPETSKELSATDAFNFVDEMRQAAKHAENFNNFVYEPTSGMYYDPKTGYYYNAEYGLYYDGNTGCYYSYDEDKKSYEFHSQAQVQSSNRVHTVDQDANSASAKDSAETKDQDEEDIADIKVEFDEWGGVITDKETLKQIKAEKQKIKDREAKTKRKEKKKHKKKSKSHKRHKYKKRHKRDHDDRADIKTMSKRKHKTRDVEDGELSHSSSMNTSSSDNSSSTTSSGEDSESTDNTPIFKAAGRFQDIAKKYPPSLRIIVQETNLEQLTVGSLHLITYKGGTLGREGTHDVIIPDVNVSKSHMKFHYDTKEGLYKCQDVGSRNGTVLNGTRMSSSLTISASLDLVHGSTLQIGQTKLLCHVHEGNSTCGLCEPGLLIETQARESTATAAGSLVVLSHKEQLKKLQKKYGLENEKFIDTKSTAPQNYNDRAATRRIQVGSSTDHEKTEVADVNTEIASSNKGFKMLSKLGWQKGETLGKTNANTGLLEPINVVANVGTSGLGKEQTIPISSRPIDKRKLENLKITQERYQRANDIFEVSDESN